MTDAQVKEFYDKMVAAKVVKADLDSSKVYTTQFVCKGVGKELDEVGRHCPALMRRTRPATARARIRAEQTASDASARADAGRPINEPSAAPPERRTRRRRPLVSLRAISKIFSNGTLALKDMSLDVGRGEFVSLLGPSGCGKSTALRIIAGLGEPTSGTVDWPGAELDAAGRPRARDRLRLPGADADALGDRVRQCLAAAPAARRVEGRRPRRGDGGARAWSASTSFADAYPRELSGGMKMRVSIARALITRPKLLLMDEPFAALDEITRFKLNNDLLHLWEQFGWTVIFVTHSVFESVYLSERIVVMAARPGRVFARPRRSTRPIRATRSFRTSTVYNEYCRQASAALACRHGESAPALTRDPAPTSWRSAASDVDDRGPPAPPPRSGSARALARIVVPIAMLVLLVVRLADLLSTVGARAALHPAEPGTHRAGALATTGRSSARRCSVTLQITFIALAIALVGGVALAILMAQSRWIELALFPYAVILQVTPIVAIAPLILIYTTTTQQALLICAWLVAFFPVLSNTAQGLHIDRPQSPQPVRALRRQPLADADPSASCRTPCPISWPASGSPAASR